MQKEPGKIRGFYFEIDGDSETLQKGLENFGAALGRALSGPQRTQKQLAAPANNRRKDNNPDGDEAQGEEVANDETDILDDVPTPGAKSPKKASGRKPAPMPNVITLDLNGKEGADGKVVSFESFIQQKAPTSHTHRFLCVAAWLKDYGGVAEVTVNHVFTCYKIANWTPHPGSYYTVLNDLVNKQDMMDKGTVAGAFTINLHGENIVAKLGSVKKE